MHLLPAAGVPGIRAGPHSGSTEPWPSLLGSDPGAANPPRKGSWMPWDNERYPASMRRLDPIVREKAIAIANALLAEGLEEGLAIRIAISKAKEWAVRQTFTRQR
jgi:hypothetical protein